jgi:hypothetical protein
LGLSLRVAPAQALLLCQDQPTPPGVTCREDIESKIQDVLTSLITNVPNERDRRGAVADLTGALIAFAQARFLGASTPLSPPDKPTEEDLCSYAGKQDDRGLKAVEKAVKGILKLRMDQFITGTFVTTRNKVKDLISVALDAVDTNIDEVDILDGTTPKTAARIVDAEKRLNRANADLLAGKLDKAANGVQSAYDVIRDRANIVGAVGCLHFQD